MDDTSSPWKELSAEVEAILAEVWTQLDVDKQLQEAQEKIDEINNGHSEIGEMLDGIEQGLLDMDSELHPTDENGQSISFHGNTAEILAKVKSDLESLQLKKEALDACPENNDDRNSDDGFVFMFSDDSASPPPSPKEDEPTPSPSVDADKSRDSTENQEPCVVEVDASTNSTGDNSNEACISDVLQQPITDLNEDQEKNKTEIVSASIASGSVVCDQVVNEDGSLPLHKAQIKTFVDKPTQMTPPRQLITVEIKPEAETKPVTTVSNTGKPISNVANTEKPVSNAANTGKPVSKTANTANTGKLVSNAANTGKPVSNVANTAKPVSNAANTAKLVSNAANTAKPVSNAANTAKPVSNAANTVKPEVFEDPDVIDLCDADDNTQMEDDQDFIECLQVEHPKTHIQDSSFRLSQGYRVLARKTSNSCWTEAVIIGINKETSSQKFNITCRFDSKTTVAVSGKQIALKSYPHPSKVHVGSRVVADCRDGSKPSGSSLRAGIIAEIPLLINKTRYLVFFDDGYAQYASLKELHLIYEASDKAWEDVPRDSREFIQDYLEKYPERPMVRLHCNQTIKTEWSGIWWRAKVLEVDGSLVNMVFPKDNRNEWLYRGSTRLEPLHREMETAKYLRESGRVVAGSSISKKRGGPCVEYQRVNPLFLVPENEILLMAEGTTTKPYSRPETADKPISKGVFVSKTVQLMPVVQWAVKTIRQWCKSHRLTAQFEELPSDKLAVLLERIYREGPKAKPDIFTPYTLHGLRSALSTYLTEPPVSHKVDIYKDAEFLKANRAFDEAVKHADSSKTTHRTMTSQRGISKRDIVKLLKSGLVSLSNPLGLLRLVWLFIQPFIGRTRGKVKSPDLDLLQKKEVIFKVALSGLPYYEINSPVLGLSGGQEQKLYATGNRFYCPYHAINLYMTKLNPGCQDFLQQPKTRINFKTELVWFEPKPMSSSFINTMMTDLSTAAKMTQMYSNADIRATTWDTLQEAIEEFSENIRLGYRKTQASQVHEMKPVLGRHIGLPAVIERTNKPAEKQSTPQTTTVKSSIVKRLLTTPRQETKQAAGSGDSDDDVIIIEEQRDSTQSASQRLMHLSNLYKADRQSAKQQTAKKSTSTHGHHHGHYHGHHHRHHRDEKYRHGGLTLDSTSQNVSGGNQLFRSNSQTSSQNVKKKTKFVPHDCAWQCVAAFVPNTVRMQRIKLQNPRSVPSMFGYERRLAKQRGTGRRHVIYHAPCGRTLRNIADVDRYLTETKTKNLCVDAFNFDPFVYTKIRHYRNSTHYIRINDISNGLEPVPVSLVNEVDRDPPPNVKYIAHRQPEKGTKIVLDPGFLICCDCTDNCKDNAKCACRMLTVSAAKEFPEIYKNPGEIGYKYRRLMSLVPTGIYECNSRCSCSKQCHNRVAQNGLSLRLQIFKTDKRGWGLRCLDDIPQGAFVCTYAGQLWGAEEANKRGQMYGDEYFAELDHIEVVENSKEGYESNVSEDEGISDSKSMSSNASNSDQCSSSGNEYRGDSAGSEGSSMPVRTGNQSDDSVDLTKAPSTDSAATKMVFRRQQLEPETGRQAESSRWSVAFPDKESTRKKVEEWVNSNPSSDSTTKNPDDSGVLGTQGNNQAATDQANKDEPDFQPAVRKSLAARKEQVAVKRGNRKDSSNKDGREEGNKDPSASAMLYGYNTSPGKVLDKSQIEAFRKRSHTGRLHMRRRSSKDLGSETKTEPVQSGAKSSDSEHSAADDKKKSDGKSLTSDKSLQDNTTPATSTGLANAKDSGNVKGNDKRAPPIRTRTFFGETSGHVMDAKFTGNLGRYLNHSCSPNLFVQNVFVDSHDLRFPWVTFFAKKYIRAGWELTWDYNYDVGSVPGRSLICLCGSSECRGRLL